MTASWLSWWSIKKELIKTNKQSKHFVTCAWPCNDFKPHQTGFTSNTITSNWLSSDKSIIKLQIACKLQLNRSYECTKALSTISEKYYMSNFVIGTGIYCTRFFCSNFMGQKHLALQSQKLTITIKFNKSWLEYI